MKGKNCFVVCVVLLALGCVALGEAIVEGSYNVTEICTIVKPGSKLASTESCSKYYQCQSSGPVALQCKTNQSFDKSKQECVAASSADCNLELEEEKLCVGKSSGTFVSNTKVCGGWLHCDNDAIVSRGYCSHGQVFKSGSCDYGSCEFSPCDVVQPDVFFGSTNDCAKWQLCTPSGVLKSNSCDNNLSFDVATSTCNYSSKVDCSRVTSS